MEHHIELQLYMCDTLLFDIDCLNLNFQLLVLTNVPNISCYILKFIVYNCENMRHYKLFLLKSIVNTVIYWLVEV